MNWPYFEAGAVTAAVFCVGYAIGLAMVEHTRAPARRAACKWRRPSATR